MRVLRRQKRCLASSVPCQSVKLQGLPHACGEKSHSRWSFVTCPRDMECTVYFEINFTVRSCNLFNHVCARVRKNKVKYVYRKRPLFLKGKTRMGKRNIPRVFRSRVPSDSTFDPQLRSEYHTRVICRKNDSYFLIFNPFPSLKSHRYLTVTDDPYKMQCVFVV